MHRRILKSLIFTTCSIAIAAVVTTGCKSAPKKSDADNAGAANGQGDVSGSNNVVGDKSILSDPLGSDSGKIDGLNTIYFEYDKSKLTSEAQKTLAANAEWIKSHAGYTVQVEGHTDARGSVEYNLALGERRAKAVKQYLQSIGVESKRMTVISYGKEKPIAQGDTEEAWGKNRRANFVPLQ